MKATASFLLLLAAGLCVSCGEGGVGQKNDPPVNVADKAFASGGSIEIHLEGGDYMIRRADDDHVRVAFGGNVANAKAELTADGAHANLAVKDTPHSNFHATIELPKTTDIVLRLGGGNLEMAAIAGNKDIECGGGNVEISVGPVNDYSSLDASVKAGNLDGGPFGKSDGGIFPHLTWSGPGKYKLRASLGAGNLELK